MLRLAADWSARRSLALILSRPLKQLDDVGVRIEDEDLPDAVAPWHGPAEEGGAVLVQANTGCLEIVDLESEVMCEPELCAGARLRAAGPAGRVPFGEEMNLIVPAFEPRAGEGEVRRARNLREPERLAVEATRALEIGDDEPDMLDAHRHDAYRNLASPRKEAQMPLIRVELFDYRMSDETSAALIEKLTDALCEATHPGLRDHTWVIVEGHSPKNWGLGGKPWPVGQMPPAPGS